MKLIYLTIDGKAKIENAKLSTRMVEMQDGYHPVTNDSVWQDAKRRWEPALVVIQGVLGPYGASMTKEDTLNVLYEIDVAERAFKPQSVSKMWQRALANAVTWMMKYGIWALVIAFVLFNVAQAFYQGYF